MIQPLVVEHRGTVLCLRLKEPRIILWINQGVYALIPIEVVKNELSIQKDKIKLSDFESYPLCTFTWNQAIVIPPETGKMLAAQYEDKTHQCTNGGDNKGNIEGTVKV